MGKGYLEYFEGHLENASKLLVNEANATTMQIKTFKDWNQGARKVMYWLSISIHDSMIGNIQDATSQKQDWDRLVSFDTTNTKARKLLLKNDLSIVKKESLSINDYTLKIKSICESLIYIGGTIDNDDKVEVCLHSLTSTYKQFKTFIQTQENISSFVDLIPLLVIEVKNLGEDSSCSQGKNNFEYVFYSNKGRGRGCGVGQG